MDGFEILWFNCNGFKFAKSYDIHCALQTPQLLRCGMSQWFSLSSREFGNFDLDPTVIIILDELRIGSR